MQSYIERVESALHDLKQGKMIIMTDDPLRENEGDLIIPAETITAEGMSFIIQHTSGIVCLALSETQVNKLQLPFMVSPHENSSLRSTPFTISIDAKNNITTGVSALDRVTTIQAAIQDNAHPDDLVKPGHVFPLQAKNGGVLERTGHTEGAIDITRLAGFKSAAVLCELMNPDGTMMRGAQLEKFAKTYQINVISVEDVILYRLAHENLIEAEVSAELPIDSLGIFNFMVVKEKITGIEHVMLSKNLSREKNNTAPLVRIHSACLTGDLFASLRCDCNKQLHYALQRISEEGGILIYLNQEGRGIGLFNKIKAYALQEKGFDTVEANQELGLPVDSRQYYIAAAILRNHNINHIRLLTNNPDKINNLKKYGISDITMETMPVFCNEYNKKYLQAKKDKLKHIMDITIKKGES